MQGRYKSRITPFYASEDLSFNFRLMQGSEVQSLEGVDISIEVFTGQITPRKSVVSLVSEESPVVEGAEIARYEDHFVLNLKPSFLKDLSTGVLMFMIRYKVDLSIISNLIRSEKFVNDLYY